MDGVLIIDKPKGMTSHDVIFRLRKIFHQKKFGHSGTLDPDATGVLVVLCGKACKVLQFLQDTDKTYQATLQLGAFTSTDDISGDVIETKEINLDFDFDEELSKFFGKQRQQVPMTSAKKIQGKKLLDYQRQNIEVPAVYQDIEIYDIHSLDTDKFSFEVHCSSGTYIRSICRDLAIHTNNAGCMASLRRTKVGRFSIDQAQTLDQLQDNAPVLYPIKSVLSHLPMIDVEDPTSIYQGKHFYHTCDAQRICICYQDEPIAIYDQIQPGEFVSKRGLW